MSNSAPPTPPGIRGKWLLFAGVVILAAVGAGSIALWRQQNAKPAPKPAVAAVPVNPTEVIGAEISLTGRIQAQKVVNVPAPIEGTVEAFLVEAGQDVFQDQLLARIRNTKLDSTLELANAELDRAQTRVQTTEAAIIAARLEASRARADASRTKSEFDRADKAYQRQKLLYREGATPRLVYEKAESDYNTLKDNNESKDAVARQMEERVDALNRDLDTYKRMFDEKTSALEQAKTDIAATEVHAPVEGMVLSRRGQPGDEVTRHVEDLFRIATSLSAMEAVVEPTPAQLQRIRPGQVATIHVAEVPEGQIMGTVREISGSTVIVDFISPTALIKPGVSAQVVIKLT